MEATASNPLGPYIWELRIQILIRARRFSEAKTVIAEGLQQLDPVWWRERAIRALLDCGDEQAAVDVAREGIRLYPRGAYLWHLLGNTLRSGPGHAMPGEIEACFRSSIELNGSYFDPVDQLSILLVEHPRFDAAEHVLLSIMPQRCYPS